MPRRFVAELIHDPQGGLLDVGDLPPEVQVASTAPATPDVVFPEDGMQLVDYLTTLERSLIQQSLDRTGGNRHKAAALLGLKRTTLVEKLKRLEKAPGGPVPDAES